jgi:hypothetical protein
MGEQADLVEIQRSPRGERGDRGGILQRTSLVRKISRD